MSIWTTYQSEIDTRLTALGYSKQSDNYNLEDPDASNKFLHKGYSLKAEGIVKDSITDGNAYHTYLIELKISYISNDIAGDNSRDENFEDFDDLLAEINNSSTNFPNFISLESDPTFLDDEISLQTTIGSIKMYYGMRGC